MIWFLLLVLLPFREGSGSPEGLLVAHLTMLLALAASRLSLRSISRPAALSSMLLLAVAALSGIVGCYPYASHLATFELAVALGTLIAVEARLRESVGLGPLLLQAIALSGLAQGILVLLSWLTAGTREAGPGTLLNPNHTAAYLVLAFWAAMAEGAAGGAGGGGIFRSRPRVLLAGVPLLGGAVLLASRGALVGLAAGFAIYAALRLRTLAPRSRRLVLAAMAVTLLAGGAMVGYRLLTRDDPFAWSRASLWGASLGVALDRPVLGSGPGSFEHVTAPYDPPQEGRPVRYGKHLEATHNDLLKIVAEMGVAGSLAALLLLVALLRGWRSALAGRGGMEAAIAAALGGLLAHSCVENLSARPAIVLTGAVLAALLLSRAGTPRCAPAPPAPPALSTRILTYGGLGAAALIFVIAPYLGYRAHGRFQSGAGDPGREYRRMLAWSPLQPDYRAALAEAVLAGSSAAPGDLAAAFRAIDDAIALKPVDPRYHLIRARLARVGFSAGPGEADWIAMASEEYGHASRLDPLRPHARLERGFMLLAVGRPGDALVDADEALRSEPSSFEAQRLRVRALADLGRWEEARAGHAAALAHRQELAATLPTNAYEAAVLRWEERGWEEIRRRLEEESL